jgi:hypothetical protein
LYRGRIGVRLQTLVVGKDSEMEVKEVEAAEMVTEEKAAGMEDLSVGVVAYPYPFLLSLVSQEEAVMGSIPMAARRTYGGDCIGQTTTNQHRGVDNVIQPIEGGGERRRQ